MSSTFLDMQAERQCLIAQVFPRLRDWCESRRLLLVDVDLRWGVPEELTSRSEITERCLAAVDGCSLFVGLVGQRYGALAEVSNDSTLPDMSVTELELRRACPDLGAQGIEGGSERDVDSSPRKVRSAPSGVRFYVRDTGWLADLTPADADAVRHYVDTPPDQGDEVHSLRLDTLRSELFSRFPASVRSYSATWDRARSPMRQLGKLRCDGLSLSDRIFEDLVAEITASFPESGRWSPEKFDSELQLHAAFAQRSARRFVCRHADLAALTDHLNVSPRLPLVVVGEAGVGKSSLLAKWALDRSSTRPDDYLEARFVGVGAETERAADVLASVLQSIARRHVAAGFLPSEATIPSDREELLMSWAELASQLLPGRTKVIVIDGVDQLENFENELDWISTQLPADVRLVVSLKDPTSLSRHLSPGGCATHLLEPLLARQERETLTQVYLADFMKELSGKELETLTANSATELPLFLCVTLSELRILGSWESLRLFVADKLGSDARAAFTAVLSRLEEDASVFFEQPRAAVGTLFALVAHSRNGLTPAELEDLLAAELEVPSLIAREGVGFLLSQVTDFLSRNAGRVGLLHESLRQAIVSRYDSGVGTEWPDVLAKYFDAQPNWFDGVPNRRKASVLVWLCIRASAWQRVEQLLCDIDFLEAKVAAELIDELLRECSLMLAHLARDGSVARRAALGRYTEALRHFSQRERRPAREGSSPGGWWSRLFGGERRAPTIASATLSPAPTDVGSTKEARSEISFAEILHALTACADQFRESAGPRGLLAQQFYNGADRGPLGEAASRYLRENELPCFLLEQTARPHRSWSMPELRPLSASRHVPGGLDQGEGWAFIMRAAMSADGRTALTGDLTHRIRVWDVDAGRCIRQLAVPDRHKYQAYESEEELASWKASSTPKGRWPVKKLRPVVLSADGAVAGCGGMVWDLPQGRLRADYTFEELGGCLAALSAGGTLAVIDGPEGLSLFDLEREEHLVRLSGRKLDPDDFGERVAATPDVRFVAAARSNDIHIWDSERLKAPQIILTNALLTQLGTVHQLSAIAIDPTGQWIVTGSTSGQICWWDARRARLIRVFREHACLLPNYREDINQAISSVSVSADARVAVSARLGEVQVWDTRTGELLRSLPAPSQQVAISADAKICLVGGWSERAAIWDRTAPVLDDPLDHRAEVTAVALSDDGTVALTGSDGATLTGHTVRVWNTSTGRLRYALDCRDAPRALALSPDGTRALVAGEYERPTQHSLEWWDLHGCSRISRVEGIDRTSGVALHPSLHRAMVTGNRHASLRSLPEGKHLKVVAAPISSLSPDGRFVAHCAPLTLFGPTRDCDALRLVDLDEQSVDEKTIVVDQTPSFNCICLGVDGKFALIGRSDGVLETWDLERERRVRTLMAHTSPVRGVALSGNQRLGASTDGRSIRFWDLSAGRCLAAYPTSESISSFRWSREGLFLLAAGRVARWGRLHFRGDSGSWGASSEDQLPDAPDTVEAIGGSALGTGAES